MKRILIHLFIAATICSYLLTSCSEEDMMFERETTEALPAIISTDKMLYADTEYLISKPVFVTNGATLSIQPGTLIKAVPASGYGRAALVITRGCRLMANGTADAPIIMSALLKEEGSWDGVIMLGNAPVSYTGEDLHNSIDGADISYGGNYTEDDSGSLNYVRIEYAGAAGGAFSFDGVGRGTTVEHCQSYRSAIDGFTFNGGTVNAKYLISTTSGENGFCFNEGYVGNLQFIKATAPTPRSAWSILACNGTADTGTLKPYTHPVIANLSTDHSEKIHGVNYPIAVSSHSCITLINSGTRNAVVEDGIPYQVIGGEPNALPELEYVLINATKEKSTISPDKFILNPFFVPTNYDGAVAPDIEKDEDWTTEKWVKR